LTESNPTRVGLPYPKDVLEALSDRGSLEYDPLPTGMRLAREAVASDYARRGVAVDPEQVVLSASTSEAYSWLFKMLCDPGDAVLIPTPSYPLFEHLTRLEGVHAEVYGLSYHGRWEIEFERLERASPRTRAVVLVSPNNPTGSYITESDLARLMHLCRDRQWAIVADEVFAEYTLDAVAPLTDIALRAEVLSFTLGGASKQLGLPQVKLAWTLVGGEAGVRQDALKAMEMVADTFLSVSTPVQHAAPVLFERGAAVRAAIQARTRKNLAALREIARTVPACTVLEAEGGWSGVVRVPATQSEEALVLGLIQEAGVLVHPGYFFDFPHEAFLVVSLLPPEEVFADGCRRLLDHATRACAAS
jgi:aspartate/methionine/tyrosine aminotransferase